MTCEALYQSEMCCEFSELSTTPYQSFTLPHVQISVRPIANSTTAWIRMRAAAMTKYCQTGVRSSHRNRVILHPPIPGSVAHRFQDLTPRYQWGMRARAAFTARRSNRSGSKAGPTQVRDYSNSGCRGSKRTSSSYSY